MSDSAPQPSAGRSEGRLPSKDIAPVLKGWDYEPGTINVRKVAGEDGRAKLQMRLDLGLLQMEITGRPDGVRPNGQESWLDVFETKLIDHRKRHGSDAGFNLTSAQCQQLREEAEMYYRRYLSLFVLEEFPGVVRDTARNLRVLDLCRKHAKGEQDRLMLEQYRPYITMMNVRATAALQLKDKKTAEAYQTVRAGLRSLKRFFRRFGQPEAYKQSHEVRALRRFGREIKAKLPVDPIEQLEKKLGAAVKAERYEDAAKLRDELAKMGHGVRPAAK